MSVHVGPVFKRAVGAVAVVLGLVACEQGAPTAPAASGSVNAPDLGPLAALGTTTYPGAKVAGRVTACKDASSPAGTYNFTASSSAPQAGDQISANFSLTPGTCAIIWERTTAGAPGTSVTITEVIPGGATYRLDRITSTDDARGTRSVAGPSEVVAVAAQHGAVATFFNVSTGHPPPPPPPPPAAHHVVLCKAGNVAGTFTFNVLATGTIASDVVQSTANLSAGSCDTVFTRVEAGPVAAAITITESVAANASTFLQGVTVDGQAAATVGAGVVVTTNFPGPNKVVVFTNAQATVGGQVAYHPSSPTPGVVHLCKSANSPPGTFNFTVNAVGAVATDQVVSNVSLTAGQCKTVFIRTVTQPVPAAITITESVTLGTVIDLVAVQNSAGVTLYNALQASGGIVVTENALLNGGNLIIFFNKTLLL